MTTNFIEISTNDRSYLYGDGLFETIIFKDGNLNYWEDHIHRLSKGCEILGYSLTPSFYHELFKNAIELVRLNNMSKGARVRIQLGRKQGGLYSPTDNGVNYLIKSVDYQLTEQIPKLKLGVSLNARLVYSTYSSLKTCNSIPYIIASIEKSQKGVDDLLILDGNDCVAESISSNIFWLMEDKVYCPSLLTGCIEGVMRKNVIKLLIEKKIEVHEVRKDVNFLKKSDGIFLSNVTGFKVVKQLENSKFDTRRVIDWIRNTIV